MYETGLLAPPDEAAVRDRYADLGLPAQVVVKESAKAMGFDAEEYRDRVTSDVVETGRDALFASLLRVSVGTRAEFDEWVAAHDGDVEGSEAEALDVIVEGAANVDNVAWHHAPLAETVLAATFQDEAEAAVATVQRMAFGRFYRDER